MAKKTLDVRKGRAKRTVQKSVSEGIKRAAERIGAKPSESAKAEAGRPAQREVVDDVPPKSWPDTTDENGETRTRRWARIDAQRELLACDVPDSLAGRLRRLLSQGQWVEPEAPDLDNHNSMAVSGEHALARVAAIQVKAIALALEAGVRAESALDDDFELTVEEAAYGLMGVATTLEIGMGLVDDLRCAKNSRARAVTS